MEKLKLNPNIFSQNTCASFHIHFWSETLKIIWRTLILFRFSWLRKKNARRKIETIIEEEIRCNIKNIAFLFEDSVNFPYLITLLTSHFSLYGKTILIKFPYKLIIKTPFKCNFVRKFHKHGQSISLVSHYISIHK